MMLNTEQNTAAMEKRVLAAARKELRRRNLQAFFEHGQWWVTDPKSGAQWSACDTDTSFCFEQVTEGDND